MRTVPIFDHVLYMILCVFLRWQCTYRWSHPDKQGERYPDMAVLVHYVIIIDRHYHVISVFGF